MSAHRPLDEDPLAPARGVIFGLVISLLIWAVVLWAVQ